MIAGGLAPRTVSTFSPFLKKRKVGIAEMPLSAATEESLSTSTLKNLMLVCWLLNSSILGEMALQGPHHSAKKSMRTASFLRASWNSASLWKS